MNLHVVGALLGAVVGTGLVLFGQWTHASRRTQVRVRVLPYIQDLPSAARGPRLGEATGALQGVFGPTLRTAADAVERVLGGSASVRRRLLRADIEKSVHDFRVDQVLWGVAGFALVASISVVEGWRSPDKALGLLLLCLVGFAMGVILCDNRLSSRVRRREQQILVEFPIVAEMLALAVAAGEGPVAALDRVTGRTAGALSTDLSRVLAEIRTGAPVARAFDDLATRSGLPVVSRFASGLAVAIERGTPLSEVLHAQAADVREAGRRELIEAGARKEVLMMVPVVFLVLPVTVVFAFWPGVIGLSLVAP